MSKVPRPLATLLAPARLARSVGLVCCLLVTFAGCDDTLLVQCLDSGLVLFSSLPPVGELDAVDDDEDPFYRPRSTDEEGHLERNRLTPSHPPASTPTSSSPWRTTLPAARLTFGQGRPGSEHQARNGLGAPLLC